MSKIVWTNGCFDLLHPGHIEHFKVGKSLGDKLIVGLDSDERVSEMKGDTRPINTFEDRKAILEAIKYIDLVLEFDSEKNNLLDITKVESWFKDFFKQTPLDHFLDTTKISNTSNFDMKIGRITNAISGEYKTF